MLRKACVANQFYPGNPGVLTKTVEDFLKSGRKKERAIGVISPHAGYIYSGKVAGSIFSSVEIPDNVILLGPNHTGLGERAAVMTEGKWETPLGKIRINEELAGLILHSSHLFSSDTLAHLGEHSLEVELPFLYLQNPNISIVPITVMPAGFTECEEMGKAVSEAVSSYKKDVLIVVSSDMNHYEADKTTREKDKLAIDKILALDGEGLLNITHSRGITMCGVIPATIAIIASNLLGAKGAKLVDYATSGDTSGDYDNVVGYAGILIK
ncbi:MAG: AmmeMemoRadiSam system protein B [Deltaproteobacteria bacterium]|nr:AmmeMemoRadiSam system protein B [Deltaproteobacteria bacterium]